MNLSDIRGSDRIAQEADIVLAHTGEVLKDREGPTGVTYDAATMDQLWRSERKVAVVSISGRARTNWMGSSDSNALEST